MKSLKNIFEEIDKLGLDGITNIKIAQPTNIFKTETPTKKVSVKHTQKFHKNKHKIPIIIYSTIDKHEIVYGEHALKKRFPKYLERPTQDYDIYSNTPKKDAKEAERALDQSFGGDFFYVKPAQHPGTYKVVAHANQEGYADYSKPDGKIPYETIDGKKYVKLSLEKEHRHKSLKDPNYSWRHAKDQDALNRIKLYEKMNRGKK